MMMIVLKGKGYGERWRLVSHLEEGMIYTYRNLSPAVNCPRKNAPFDFYRLPEITPMDLA